MVIDSGISHDSRGSVPETPPPAAGRPRYPRSLLLVPLVGLLVTLAGVHYAGRPHGIYWARTYVSFFVPYSTDNKNVVSASSHSLVMTAGAVGAIVDPTGGKQLLADQSVTLASEGITHGWAVTVPNTGSQWKAVFDSALLQVEAVGASPAEVTATMRTVLARVTAAFHRLQDDQSVPAYNAVTIDFSPPGAPVIAYTAGLPSRAKAAVLLLGAGGTLVACYLARLVVRRRRDARAHARSAA